MQIQKLPFLFLFFLAFAARGIRAEDTFSWSWCELFPFLRVCKDDPPPCDGRLLRRGRRSDGFSWTWCQILPFLCKKDEDNGGCENR